MNDSSAALMNATTIEPTAPPTSAIRVTAPEPPAPTLARLAASRGRQPRDRELADDVANVARQPELLGQVVARPDGLDDDPANGPHLVRSETPRGRGRRPDPDPRRRVRRQGVERDGVLVDRDPDLVEQVLGLLAGHPQGRHVDQQEVIVGPA